MDKNLLKETFDIKNLDFNKEIKKYTKTNDDTILYDEINENDLVYCFGHKCIILKKMYRSYNVLFETGNLFYVEKVYSNIQYITDEEIQKYIKLYGFNWYNYFANIRLTKEQLLKYYSYLLWGTILQVYNETDGITEEFIIQNIDKILLKNIYSNIQLSTDFWDKLFLTIDSSGRKRIIKHQVLNDDFIKKYISIFSNYIDLILKYQIDNLSDSLIQQLKISQKFLER